MPLPLHRWPSHLTCTDASLFFDPLYMIRHRFAISVALPQLPTALTELVHSYLPQRLWTERNAFITDHHTLHIRDATAFFGVRCADGCVVKLILPSRHLAGKRYQWVEIVKVDK